MIADKMIAVSGSMVYKDMMYKKCLQVSSSLSECKCTRKLLRICIEVSNCFESI